ASAAATASGARLAGAGRGVARRLLRLVVGVDGVRRRFRGFDRLSVALEIEWRSVLEHDRRGRHAPRERRLPKRVDLLRLDIRLIEQLVLVVVLAALRIERRLVEPRTGIEPGF